MIVLIASLAVAFTVLPTGRGAQAATGNGVTPVPGAAQSWGLNSSGQLGNGATANQSTPVAVSLPNGVTLSAIVGGSAHTLGLASNGTVYAWGANTVGQLGNGTTTGSTVPVRVHLSLPSNVTATAIAAGSTFSLALASNGTVYAWGANTLGQLGNGSTVAYSTLPVAVSLSAGATAIAAGGNDGLAIVGGHVYAWGDNTDGALGHGTAGGFSRTPVAVSLPSASAPAAAIAAGGEHGLALGANHTLYAWGSNAFGHLGNGTTVAYSDTPVAVSIPAQVTVTAVADGGNHALALDAASGAVYAWGDDRSGQLGNGIGEDEYDNACNTENDDGGSHWFSNVPVRSLLPNGVSATAIAAGACDSIALATDGTVYAWGDDTYGQLGNGATKTFYLTPIAVHLPSGTLAAAVMAGDFHTALIQSEMEGTAYPGTTTVLRGTNSSGQIFILTIPPGAVTDPTTFTANEVAPSSLPPLPSGVTLIGLPESFKAVDDLTGDSVDHFGAQLILDMSYPSSLVAAVAGTARAGTGTAAREISSGISSSSTSSTSSGQLTLATTEGTSPWQTIPSTTTTPCCFVQASVDHFSVYAVWLIPSATSIEDLVRQLFASGDINNAGIETALLAKLRAAAAARAAGNCTLAGQIYQAFINQVRAQTGQHIDAKAANLLIPAAQYLIANCP